MLGGECQGRCQKSIHQWVPYIGQHPVAPKENNAGNPKLAGDGEGKSGIGKVWGTVDGHKIDDKMCGQSYVWEVESEGGHDELLKPKTWVGMVK